MKVYFDNNGCLCIDSENNTEMLALQRWGEIKTDDEGNYAGASPVIRTCAHLEKIENEQNEVTDAT